MLPLAQATEWQGCVLAYGHFSTIHPGHIRYLRHARSLGKQLVVALIGDGSAGQPNSYPFSQHERAEALGLLGIADLIVPLEGDDLAAAIRQLQPEMLVLGTELEGSARLEQPLALLRAQGGKVQFHAGDVQYASSELLNSTEQDLKRQRQVQFKAACRRQGLSRDDLLSSMQCWPNTRLIVLGDTIVDQYVACEAIGMSAEAPVVVVRELAKRNFIGAAAVVAAHIRSLGAQCDLVSVVGQDSTAELVQRELLAQGIGNGLTRDPSRPTTFKKRYVVENQKLFRVSRLEQHNLDSAIEEQVIAQLESLAPQAQGIVVSDFVYGVVTPMVLKVVADLAQRHGLMLFGDLQCSSQVGSISRFQHFSLLCPNERELRLALQDKDSGLENLSQLLLESTSCERLLVKLAAEGFIAYDRDSQGKLTSQPFPALSVNPLDVAGAGDSVLAVMATGLASGQAMMATAALACCMASLAVQTMGNTPIPAGALKANLEEVLEP
ncbi:PfkB family carbohydrate kinase [Cyanobium sp. WAJ14-Wanaka]|uniref:PfkB family carbohydrate kinase n=1 Tax=Cyanobium sp. WAJ14-Wanaka TaxID=2823725 RepID=UPI0020CCE04D|nr:PfkB family carbohydrate kinase [Cyanobium sp. WAJ14-Wanaka]MCP9775664.1 adenylyltransferase/cytidyltransferase family protein [Cyanobium sp. WAJ14-Wanaka]